MRAGTPPTAAEMLWRYHRIGNEQELSTAMLEWEEWFAQLTETHTTLRVDFAGWRVNYDTPLLALAEMLEAPVAPWTSDRPPLTGMSRMGRASSMRR